MSAGGKELKIKQILNNSVYLMKINYVNANDNSNRNTCKNKIYANTVTQLKQKYINNDVMELLTAVCIGNGYMCNFQQIKCHRDIKHRNFYVSTNSHLVTEKDSETDKNIT